MTFDCINTKWYTLHPLFPQYNLQCAIDVISVLSEATLLNLFGQTM